ncbi:MAG: hypothetical protein A6F70_03330 [Cycloclasticus sp. symbiont of Bathymodiolus heckerae]|nr:MAG: hypothetical protein A6F70_03330 [Cycloclasticus sp. symbiont of Bathymodiolus heckerae]
MPTKKPMVLVTRPAHQSDKLCRLLTNNGFSPLRFPTIEIQELANSAAVSIQLQSAEDYDFLIFISANAVVEANKLVTAWPTNKTIIAIGPETARSLKKIGLSPTITAKRPFNSEQLLAQISANANQNKGLIIKGEGGRTLLADTLRKRGLIIDTANVYKRGQPVLNNRVTTAPEFITITSQLALKNLFLLLPQQADALKEHSTFILFSKRIADYAKELGCQHTICSEEASDSSLVFAMINDKNHSGS